MKGLIDWLEKYLVPVAVKFSQIRWLGALKDAFIETMPITMAGSVATLLNAILQTYPAQWGWTGFVQAVDPLIQVNNVVTRGSISVFALIFAALWGYHLATAFKVDGSSAVIVSLSAFMMGINSSTTVPLTEKLGAVATKALTKAGLVVASKSITVNNSYSLANLGSSSLFTAMIFGGLALTVYIWLMKKDITIKMPDTVPPAVSQAFVALIPGIAGLYFVGIINYLFTWTTGKVFGDWLSSVIQAPLLHAGQSFGMVMLVTFLVQILWFFGIHGTGVMGPVMSTIWGPASIANLAAQAAHQPLPYKWTQSSWVYSWYGGAGGTLVLLVAILLLSKREDERSVAKLAIIPGIFNINEPVMFGLPIVLNAMYFIPYMVAPLVTTALSYAVTMLGWVNPLSIQVPWITPPILDAWMETNFDFRAIILDIICIAISFAIWIPFVLASTRMQKDELASKGETNEE